MKKGKRNQDRRLQQCWIHPNSSGQVGNFCPVIVLNEYISIRKNFFHTSLDDHMFPNLSSMLDVNTRQQVISLKQPVEPMKYDNLRNHLKAQLEHSELTSLRVNREDYGTHSFRIGGLSVLGNDGSVSPAFIQKSARHKHLSSTMRYIRRTLKSALRASDILFGNDPNKGWSERFTGRADTQNPFLIPAHIRSAPATIPPEEPTSALLPDATRLRSNAGASVPQPRGRR